MNNTNNISKLLLRIDNELMDALRTMASKEKRSINKQIEYLIDKELLRILSEIEDQ